MSLAALRTSGRGDVLKSWGRDRQAKVLEGLMRAPHAIPTGDTLIVAEVPSASMLDSLLALPVSSSVVLAADPRAARLARRRGFRVVELLAGRWRGPRFESDGSVLRARLRDFDAGFDRAFGGALARLLCGLRSDYVAMQHVTAEVRPSGVVMASDQHRYGVLAAWAASSAGVPSIVLQHGFAVLGVAYLPVRASAVAAIGPASREWFIANGAPADRVFATGTPRFAPTAPLRLDVAPVGRLLVVLDPDNEAVTRELVALAMEAARLTGCEVDIRPHPSDHRFAGPRPAIAARLGIAPDARWTLDTAPLGQRLAQTDLVLVRESTVAFDALQAGVPVVCAAGATPGSLEVQGLPAVASSAEIGALLRSGPARAELVEALSVLRARLVTAGGATATENVMALLRSLDPRSGS
jgi:hypothetical protein